MIDVTQVVKDFDGEAINVGEDEDEQALTLRLVCTRALTALFRDENIPGEDKLKRAILAERIYMQDEVELKAEEISMVKFLVGKFYAPLVVMRAFRMLDPGEGGDVDTE